MGPHRWRWAAGLAGLLAATFLGSAQPAEAKGQFTQGLETAIDDLVGLIGMAGQNNMGGGEVRELDKALKQLLRVLEDKGTKHHHHHGHFGKGTQMLGSQNQNQVANSQQAQTGQLGKGMRQIGNQGCAQNPNQTGNQTVTGKQTTQPTPNAAPGGPIAKAAPQPQVPAGNANGGQQSVAKNAGPVASRMALAKTSAPLAGQGSAAKKSGSVAYNAPTTKNTSAVAGQGAATRKVGSNTSAKGGTIATGLAHLGTNHAMHARLAANSPVQHTSFSHAGAGRQNLSSPWHAGGTHAVRHR